MNQVFSPSSSRRDRQSSEGSGAKLLAAIALLSSITGATGCAGDPLTDWEEPVDSISQEWGPGGLNGVPPHVIPANHLSTTNTDLAGVTSGGSDPAKLCSSYSFDSLLNKWVCVLNQPWSKWLLYYGNSSHPISKDRHQVLKALIQCALFPSDIVKLPGFAAEPGMFGLYTDWTSTSIPGPQRELLSSCFAAKINAFGVQVPIAFVGSGPGVGVDQPVLDPAFKYQEATFWGNLFGKAPLLMACSGKHISGVGTYTVGKNLRVCGDIGSPCNIKALGACGPAANRCASGPAGSNANPSLGGGEYCPTTTDGVGNMFNHSLTVYLETAPKLVVGDVYRCGLKGDQLCDDGQIN